MPLILDPDRYSESALRALIDEHRKELSETLAEIDHPTGTVQDPGSFRTARELVAGILALIDDRAGHPLSKPELAGLVNAAYATLLASVDLMKSHSDVPKVPRSRSRE